LESKFLFRILSDVVQIQWYTKPVGAEEMLAKIDISRNVVPYVNHWASGYRAVIQRCARYEILNRDYEDNVLLWRNAVKLGRSLAYVSEESISNKIAEVMNEKLGKIKAK
jgi:hypothetical protein